MAVLEYKPIIYLIGHNIPNTTNDLQPQTALLLLIFIFGVAASFLGFVYSSFPDMSETESSYVKFPKVGVTIHHNILDLSFNIQAVPALKYHTTIRVYRILKTLKNWEKFYRSIKNSIIHKYCVGLH